MDTNKQQHERVGEVRGKIREMKKQWESHQAIILNFKEIIWKAEEHK